VIVGIDHGNEKRLLEYNPYNHPDFGMGEGKEYLHWMVNQVIPEIETRYRIDRSIVKRGIGGSSMGGLISLYAIHEYPDIFGHAALFSVSFPIAPEAINLIHTIDKNSKTYFVTGQKEGKKMVGGVMAADSILNISGFEQNDYFTQIIPDGEHNEKLWDTAFVDYYKWISEKW
jgi:alpha-glucosidase